MTLAPTRLAARVSTGVVLAVVLVGVAAPATVARASLGILVAGFVLGLPHGAVDHLLPFRTAGLRRSGAHLVLVLLAYLAVAGLAWAGLVLAGAVVLPLLLVVSVLHFGAGDVMAGLAGSRPAPAAERLPEVVARGGWVVAGPLLAWPGPTAAALSALGGSVPTVPVRLVVAAIVSACSLRAVARAARHGELGTVVEVPLLATLFLVVPPLAAFGVYFGAWHALRHSARLVEVLPGVRRFARDAAVPTLVAAAGATGIVLLAGSERALAGSLFAVLLALTVPHLVAVGLLDRALLRSRADAAARSVVPAAR